MLARCPYVLVTSLILSSGGLSFADDALPVRVASLPQPASLNAPITAETTKLSTLVGRVDGSDALQYQIKCLKAVSTLLEDVTCYTAEMTKQERIGGDLGQEQKISLKLRQADESKGVPKSIYMKWKTGDRGREVIYVDGQNNGKMLVHAGGWKARILPVLSLDPSGTLALSEARHPITNAGLKHLAQRWLTVRLSDQSLTGVKHTAEPSTFDGRDAIKFTVEYSDPSQHEEYRKSELWIDKALNTPVASQNYAWSVEQASDAETLVERYEYRELSLNVGLTDADFDRRNRRYSFRN